MHQALHMVSLQQVEIFLCVMEQESFTKAALQLHITQSAVSKSIAKLEKDLDLRLFMRHYRAIHATEAARDLYRSWKEQFRAVSDSYEKVWEYQHAADHTLRVGVTSTTDLHQYFWPIIDAFRLRFPEAELELDRDSITNLIAKLADGHLDLIFLPDFMQYKLDELGFRWKWAAQDTAQVIMSKKHPLADQELTLENIRHEKIVVLDEKDYPGNARLIRELFHAAGIDIQISSRQFKTPEGIASFYREADGILLTDRYFLFEDSTLPMVRKPLDGIRNGIICGWDPENGSRYLKNLLKQL